MISIWVTTTISARDVEGLDFVSVGRARRGNLSCQDPPVGRKVRRINRRSCTISDVTRVGVDSTYGPVSDPSVVIVNGVCGVSSVAGTIPLVTVSSGTDPTTCGLIG